MSTSTYRLPEVDPETLLDFVDASNRLGTKTDAVLKSIYNKFPVADFRLKPASTEPGTLGGVKVGDGFEVADGVLSVAGVGYDLPVASANVLGGIRAGRNVEVSAEGVIGLGIGAINVDTIGTDSFADGAVTGAKLATPAVTRDKLAEGVYNDLVGAQTVWKDAQTFKFRGGDPKNPYAGSNYGRKDGICLIKVGGLQIFLLKCECNLATPDINRPVVSTFWTGSNAAVGKPFYENERNVQIEPGAYFTDTVTFGAIRYAADTGTDVHVFKGIDLVTLNGSESTWASEYIGATSGVKNTEVWEMAPAVTVKQIVSLKG